MSRQGSPCPSPVTRRDPLSVEVDMVSRPYPALRSQGRAPRNHFEAAALFRARAAWWVALADRTMNLVEGGCTDSIHDVREALAQAHLWSPGGIGFKSTPLHPEED